VKRLKVEQMSVVHNVPLDYHQLQDGLRLRSKTIQDMRISTDESASEMSMSWFSLYYSQWDGIPQHLHQTGPKETDRDEQEYTFRSQ